MSNDDYDKYCRQGAPEQIEGLSKDMVHDALVSFAFGRDGVCIMHPRLSSREGKDAGLKVLFEWLYTRFNIKTATKLAL